MKLVRAHTDFTMQTIELVKQLSLCLFAAMADPHRKDREIAGTFIPAKRLPDFKEELVPLIRPWL